MKIVECVPNFSEGRRKDVIEAILAEVRKISGVTLLDAESDSDHNRCVVTFVGEPQPVKKAALAAAVKAVELIDLTKHQGAHPRMGAVDVVPFIPVSNVTVEECVQIAKEFGKEFSEKCGVPIYLYEDAATRPERKNLADIRKGEFEGLREIIGKKPEDSRYQPDFGPNAIHPAAGATVTGSRFFLVAFNVNLGTTDIALAKNIAKMIREKDGGFKCVKAMGFELKERGLVQVSMNMTNYTVTPVWKTYEKICEEAAKAGVPVVESEIVGLLPEAALIDCAEHYLKPKGFSHEQILEYKLRAAQEKEKAKLVGMPVTGFLDELASDAPAPGGGSVAALAGAQAAGLASMVARLTIGKKGYETIGDEMKAHAANGDALRTRLTEIVDEDTQAFNKVMAAYKLPKNTDDEKIKRSNAIQEAMKLAARVPMETMRQSFEAMLLARDVAEKGNANSITDAAVAGLMAHAAMQGAELNVRINLGSIKDLTFVEAAKREIADIAFQGKNMAEKIKLIVAGRMS